MWGSRAGVQVSKREFHTHILLVYARVEFLSCIKKKKSDKVTNRYIREIKPLQVFWSYYWKNKCELHGKKTNKIILIEGEKVNIGKYFILKKI